MEEKRCALSIIAGEGITQLLSKAARFCQKKSSTMRDKPGWFVDASPALSSATAERGGFEPMTDQELHDYSAGHLYYEMWMLYETAARLVHDPAVHSEWVLKNALIESFTVHARSLAIFLYPEEAKKYPDDVTSDEYVKDVRQWGQARGTISPELKTVIQRTGKEIAHLTTKRHPPGAPEKVWSPEPIVRAFFEPLRLFAAHVPSGRLDVSVSAFISNLSAGHGVVGSPASQYYTDVSTP